MTTSIARRDFLAAAAIALAARVARADALARVHAPSHAEPKHPTPRPGVTAAKLPSSEELADTPDAIPAFDMVRQIPEIADGIRCTCGCAERPEYYSLLTCYEGTDAMARHCTICQGQGRLAFRMHGQGKSLDEIRKGIDARFG
jgi:hypothetical protein